MKIERLVTSHAFDKALHSFTQNSRFCLEGAIVTDLDGTAVHEREGRVAITGSVSHGLKSLSDRGRPVILNSLRFPLNVIQTFGREWYDITSAPLPLVSLNGSVIGHLDVSRNGSIVFEEVSVTPLDPSEITAILEGVSELIDGGFDEIVLFHYPRDWRVGEIAWTPSPKRVDVLAAKYVSASRVISSSVAELEDTLIASGTPMIALFVDAPQDRLMAYQHARPSSFITHDSIDKLSGLAELAGRAGIDLSHAVGAGDTEMDSFLAGVGLSVHVGQRQLPYKGICGTVNVRDPQELGALLFRLSELHDGDCR